MADEGLLMEARLKDFISNNLKTIEANLRNFSDNSKKVLSDQTKVTDSAAKSAGIFERQIRNLAVRFGPGALAAGAMTSAIFKLKDGIRQSSELFMSFEHQISRMRAIMTPTSDEVNDLKEAMSYYGRTTVFTAVQTGEALVNMGKLGVDAASSIAVLPDALNLAAGSEEGLERSTEIMISTLRQFNLDTSQATRVADVMAKSFNDSALDLARYTDAMKYVGPVARNMGVSLEETTAAIEVLAQQQVVGSQAGTGLRHTLALLGQEHSKVGKLIGAESVQHDTLYEKLRKVRDLHLSAGQTMEIFGLYAGTAATILTNNVDELDKFTESLKNADGASAEMSKTMLDDVKGASILLKSAQEGLGIAIGETFAAGKIDALKRYANWFNIASEYVRDHKSEIEGLVVFFRQTFIFIGDTVGKVVKVMILHFDTFAAVFYSVMEDFNKSFLFIANTINSISKKIKGSPLFDTASLQDNINRYEQLASKSADNVVKILTGMHDKASNIGKKKGKNLPILEDTTTLEDILNEVDEKQKQIIAATERFEKSKINLSLDGYTKQLALTKVSNVKELAELADNTMAQNLVKKAQYNELLLMDREHRIKLNEYQYERDIQEIISTRQKEEEKQNIVKKYADRYMQIADDLNSKSLTGRIYTINEQINSELSLWKYYQDTGLISQQQYENMRNLLVKQASQERLQIYMQEVSQLGNMTGQMLGSWQSYLSTKRNSEYQAQVEKIKNMNLSQKQEEALLKKAEGQNRAAAKKEQNIAVGQALINGALAITNALTVKPWPLAIAAAALATATSAFQVATIKRQQFAKGGVVDTLLGEQGSEYVSGYGMVNKPTFASLPVGTRVYNNTETKNMFGGSTVVLNIPAGTPVDSRAADRIEDAARWIGDALVKAKREGRLIRYESMV